ncbi:PAS domain-containing protein, partial [bacterium]|nr:PAS domain-containing protein [bacterium]
MDSTDDVDKLQANQEPPARQWHWHRILHLVVSPLLAIAVFSIGIPNYIQGWNEKTAAITAERHLADLSAQHLHRVDSRLNQLHTPNAINRAVLSSGSAIEALDRDTYAQLHDGHFAQNPALLTQAIVSFTYNLLAEGDAPSLDVAVIQETQRSDAISINEIRQQSWFQAIAYSLKGREEAQISDIHPLSLDERTIRTILVSEKVRRPQANVRTDRTYSISLVDIDMLLKNSMSDNRLGGAIDHRIYFVENGQKQLVHQSNAAFNKFANREPLTRRSEIESGGKQWLLEVSADKRSLAQSSQGIEHAIFASRIIGLLIAALILYLRWIEDKNNQTALRATKALRTSNDNLRQTKKRIDLAINASRDGIWDWNLNKNRVYCNQRLFEILGITTDADSRIEADNDSSFYATKRGWSFMTHMLSQDDAIALQQDYKSLNNTLEKSTYHRKMCLKHNNGHNIWVIVNATIIRDSETNEIKRMVGTLSDITLTQYVENNLKQEKELLKVTIDAVNEAIIMINKNGIVKHANQNACQLLNISERYFVKTPVCENLNLFDPNISANIELLIRQCMEADSEISLREKIDVHVY